LLACGSLIDRRASLVADRAALVKLRACYPNRLEADGARRDLNFIFLARVALVERGASFVADRAAIV
jgi:hypothetical protein